LTEDSKDAALRTLLREVERLRAVEERLRTENEHLLETQRALEENRDRYSDLFDSAPVPWLALDKAGTIRNLNLVAVTLMGAGRRHLVGAPLTTLVHPEDRKRLLDHLFASQTTSLPLSCELRLVAGEKSLLPVRLSTRRSERDGESLMVALTDLRERDAAAAERQRLAEAEREARAANEAKDQFIAMLSHELRTPLTPVLAAASALAEFPELPLEVRETLAIVQRNVTTEAQLIDDLLDLARIAHGKLRVEKHPVDIHRIVCTAIETVTQDTEHKQLQVVTDLTAARYWVSGDATRLQQVFWNLLRNAIKFSNPGGQIAIRTWNSGERLLIEISDIGRGIDAATLTRLFEPFEQAYDENAASAKGLGLGLPITRGILDQHEATIVADSQGLGKGARFVIEIDTIAPPTLRPTQRTTTPPPPGKTTRILLVEDHEDTADIFERLLRRGGYEVRVESSLKSALSVDREAFDLLLSDVGLADGSGLDLMRAMRKRGKVKGIALSGYGTDEDVRASKDAGFAAHLTKPVNFGELLAAIAALDH
jgi:PAS domain S-box-containing protein